MQSKEEKKKMQEMQDSELLLLCAEKNEEAFTALAERYEKFVYSTVYCELKDPEDAFDVSQEVFIRLWNAADGFRCESTLKTWLYRMCKNCAYDYMRKYYKRKTLSLSDPREGEERPLEETLPSPEYSDEQVIKKEKIEAVRRAVKELPEEFRDVIILREFEGLSYADIAEAMTISEGTVKSRISRARGILLKKLKNYK